MAQNPDYYELHRGLLREALKEAEDKKKKRPAEEQRKSSLEREKLESEAKILEDRHKAKVAKIVVERPYLQS